MQLNYKNYLGPLVEVNASINWENKDTYACYLAQTYYYVAHSTRLLASAASRFSQEEAHFHRRFLKHCQEENSHEILAKNDLEKLGYKLSDFPELEETRMFYEAQYYKVEHLDPISLLGYILPLEIIACTECPKLYHFVRNIWGEKCASFLKVHGEEDPDHVDKALELLNSLSPSRLKIIEENFKQTVKAFSMLLRACESNSQTISQLRSA
jgi:thiaminase